MNSTSVHGDAMSAMLHADGPDPAYVEQLALFGWLVGSWRVENRLRDSSGGWSSHPGRWSAGWILGGRAIQDVLDCPDAENRYPGTTIRCYDPAAGLWRTFWHDPHSGLHVTLLARADDAGITLEGTTHLGTSVRWLFSDLTAESFHWQGFHAADGANFELVQEMHAHRE